MHSRLHLEGVPRSGNGYLAPRLFARYDNWYDAMAFKREERGGGVELQIEANYSIRFANNTPRSQQRCHRRQVQKGRNDSVS